MRECGALLLTKGQGMVSVNPDGRAKTVIIQCSETCIALAHVVLYITLHFYFLCSLGCSCGHVLGLAHQVTLQEPRWAVTKHPALAMAGESIRAVQGAAGQGLVPIISEFKVFTHKADSVLSLYPSNSCLVLKVWEKPAEDCKWSLWLWQILEAKFISKLSERIVAFSHHK